MDIRLNSVGKKFNNDWIFKNLSCTISSNNPTVILGGNGSGKSTLSQIIGGFSLLSEGEIEYKNEKGNIPSEEIYKYVSFASPYQELIEEFTFAEILAFQNKLKPFTRSVQELEELLGLKQIQNKSIKNYSSGMKQRVKLLLAICTNSDILNTDGVKWYQELLLQNRNNRCILIASNYLENEYFICENKIDLRNYK